MTYIHPLETVIQTKQYYTSKYFMQIMLPILKSPTNLPLPILKTITFNVILTIPNAISKK
jgi:hypothetical protein